MDKIVCTVEKTNLVGGTKYHNEAWWAVDEDNIGTAGPCETKKELLRNIASHNRDVKSGKILHRLISVIK